MNRIILCRVNAFRLCLLITTCLSISCDDNNDDLDFVNPDIKFEDLELTGAAEVPAVSTTGTGTLNATYNDQTNILTFDLTWNLGNPNDQVTGIHFHGPATPFETAPVAIPITGFTSNASGSLSQVTRKLTDDEEEDLKSGLWYINIHSSTYSNGELRGNLIP
jgi:hypothetical protein